MRLLRSRRAWFAAVAPLAIALAAPPTGHAEPDPKELVLKLGHADYHERERAAAALKTIGEKALPAVRDGTNSPDAEIRTRSHVLVFALMVAAGKSSRWVRRKTSPPAARTSTNTRCVSPTRSSSENTR